MCLFLSFMLICIETINGRFVNERCPRSSASPHTKPHPDPLQLDLKHNQKVFEIPINAKLGKKRFKTQQYYQGLPVIGASLVIDEDQNQIQTQTPVFGYWCDTAELTQKVPSVTPTLASGRALQIVFDILGITRSDTHSVSSELGIFCDENPYLVYSITIFFSNPPGTGNPDDVFRSSTIINALSPYNTLKHYHSLSSIMNACGRGGNAKIGEHFFCASQGSPFFDGADITYTDPLSVPEFYNNDFATPFAIYDRRDSSLFQCAKYSPDGSECDGNSDDNEVNGGYGPALDVLAYTNNTFAMYQEWINEPPINQAALFPVVVHHGTNWINAAYVTWSDGHTEIWIGDGNINAGYHPLGTASITAHEFAHGFTRRYSDLLYGGESGGINEAYSDIVGMAAAYYFKGDTGTQWRPGYDARAGAGAFRYMHDPPSDGRSIDHWCDYHDQLDVHYSSGLYNKAAWLMNHDANYAFSEEQIFKIFSNANRNYWGPFTTFQEGVCGVTQALGQLYSGDGSFDSMILSVENSFLAVGLGCDRNAPCTESPTSTTDSPTSTTDSPTSSTDSPTSPTSSPTMRPTKKPPKPKGGKGSGGNGQPIGKPDTIRMEKSALSTDSSGRVIINTTFVIVIVVCVVLVCGAVAGYKCRLYDVCRRQQRKRWMKHIQQQYSHDGEEMEDKVKSVSSNDGTPDTNEALSQVTVVTGDVLCDTEPQLSE